MASRPSVRRADRGRGGLRVPRSSDDHGAAPRHRQARPDARLPGLPVAGARRRTDSGGAGAEGTPRAWRRPRARRRRPRAPVGPAEARRLDHRAPPRAGRRRGGRIRAPRRHARALQLGRWRQPERAPQVRSRGRHRPGGAAGRALRPAVPDPGQAAPGRSVPAVGPRGRRAQASGCRQRLQADRARARPVDVDGPYAPAQHLRQARRRRPRSGGPHRHRARAGSSARLLPRTICRPPLRSTRRQRRRCGEHPAFVTLWT